MMQKLILVSIAAVLMLGTAAFEASAQNQQRGAGAVDQLKNFSPFVRKVACEGYTGICGCGPGRVDACWNRTRKCCGCVPC
jgi:hypothetical protein